MRPGAGRAVAVDGILEALRALDMHERTKREVRRRRTFEMFRLRRARTQPGSGNGLSS
jgi:hypothetical protein